MPLFSEVKEIFKELPEYLKTFCQGCVYTGYRRGELERLTFSDIDFDYKEIRLNETKTDSPRNTTMYPELFEHMKKQRDEARKIFGKLNVNKYPVYRHVDKRTPIIRAKTYAPWRKANIEAGCVVMKDDKEKSKYRMHDLRKHAIKFLKHKKKFPKDAIRTVFTGHKDVMVFELVYNIVSGDDLQYYREQILAA